MLLAVAALTLVLLGRSVMQEPVMAISREVWNIVGNPYIQDIPRRPIEENGIRGC